MQPHSLARRALRLLGRSALRRTPPQPPPPRPSRVPTSVPRPPDRRRPTVSVVVTAGPGRQPELDATLTSLRSQQHRRIEVLVALDDPTGPEGRTAGAHAARDRRVVLVETEPRTVASHRDRAAALARGTYLGFLAAGDVVPTPGLARLVESLESSGSDFALGLLTTETGFHRDVVRLPHPAHERALTGVALQDCPDVVTDTHDENRLYRTSFWRSTGLRFDDRAGGVAPALRAAVTAGRFDVVPERVCKRMLTDSGRFGGVASVVDGLDAWLVDQAAARRFLDGLGMPMVREAWAFGACDIGVVPFLDDVERVTADQWVRLRAFLSERRQELSDRSWRRVRAEARVKIWLAVHDRRADLERFVAERSLESGNRRTCVRAGVVVAEFDGAGEAVPGEVCEMTERETPLAVHLHDARWTGGARLELDVFTYIRFVGMSQRPQLRAALVAPDGREHRLPVTPGHDPEANLSAGHRHQDYALGAATVHIDLEQHPVASWGEEPGDLPIVFVLSSRGLERRGTITSREERTSAGLLGDATHAPRIVAGRFVGLKAAPRRGVVLRVAPAPDVRALSCAVEGRLLTGTLAGSPTGTIVARRQGAADVRGHLEAHEDGTTRFSLRLPPGPGHADRPWQLAVADRDGSVRPVAFPQGVPGLFLGPTGADLVVARDGAGHVTVAETSRPVLLLTAAHLEDRHLRLTGRWVGPAPASGELRLQTRRATLTATCRTQGQRTEARVPLFWDEWGLGQASVPHDIYTVTVRTSDPERPARVMVDDAPTPRLMRSVVGRFFRMALLRQGSAVAVRLGPPLTDEERGPRAQQLLQEWAGSLRDVEEAAYLQSYEGHQATDSPRAIHEELVAGGWRLPLHWGVAAPDAAVPAGGTPVLLYSREWYRVVGTARYLVTNANIDRMPRKKPQQRLLQTFHGYPSKSMGIGLWEAKGLTPRRIELELRRTTAQWDLILTPCPEMDRHYREQYAYRGEIESSGYPRDDALLAAGADDTRERTRRLLGIGAGQTAVLYAPTWRDQEATHYRSATLTRHLDLEAATSALGPEFIILMRGHRFHARGADRSGRTARWVDVTDYPEINDLVLASDAAVLDYSSLRFDYALTGRPMLFLVPDLAHYSGGARGFLHPFESSAPGPLLDRADRVVAALQDLKTVRRRYAAAYEAFNRTFNHRQDGASAARVVRRFFG